MGWIKNDDKDAYGNEMTDEATIFVGVITVAKASHNDVLGIGKQANDAPRLELSGVIHREKLEINRGKVGN